MRQWLSWGGIAQRQTLNKFIQDKAFEETDQLIIIAEGYLLNKTELFGKYIASTMAELIRHMLQNCGETFFAEFRGCFSGAIYIKAEDKWIIYTNQIGDNPIFYLNINGKFAAASQVNYLLGYCKEQGIDLTFSESCAYQMLTYGYVVTNETYANEIKRLYGGDYLVYQNGKLEVKTYHRFGKHTERFEGKTEAQIIDEIDRVFRNAVALEWGKDDEYGYRHLADLSGGLDSRMNLWVAHEMQDRHMTVLTYCKEGYLDEIIAKEITDFWNDDFLFKPLDDAAFMYDLEDNTDLLSGLSLYSGITGGKRFLASLDLKDYGIEHTGMVGDIALGSFYHRPDDGNRKWPTGMYSEKLKSKLPEHVQNEGQKYYDHEIFLMYARGFHGACNSHLIRRNYTEVGSPFLNVEFMQLCFDIPVKLRIGHYIYKKWIIQMYPQAAKFKWEKIGGRITEKHSITVLRRLIKKGPKKLLRMLGLDTVISEGMNPIDYWISKDVKLREFLDKSKEKLLREEKQHYSPTLTEDLSKLYDEGNASEKAMVLTVLSATKMYFSAIRNGIPPQDRSVLCPDSLFRRVT
jgi:asparagine synthase (glutamine-hydrolysing)